MLEIDNDGVSRLWNESLFIAERINNIKYLASKASEDVVQIHKKMGIRYSYQRLLSLQNLIENNIRNNHSIPDEIKSKFENYFKGYNINVDGINLSTKDENKIVDISVNLRNQTYEFSYR
jgi:hypothetical protein